MERAELERRITDIKEAEARLRGTVVG